MAHLRTWIAFGVAALTTGSAAPSYADSPSRISVTRAQGSDACPSASSVARLVVKRLGRDPFSDAAEDQVEVTFSHENAQFKADIRVRAQDGHPLGERVLTGSSCEPLGDAVALAVALYIDPNAALSPEAKPVTAASPTPPALPPALPKDVSQPCTRGHAELRPAILAKAPASRLFAGAHLSSELVPGVALGMQVGGALELTPRLWLRAEGLLVPERRSDDGRFAFGATMGFLGLCADALTSPNRRTLALGGCASVGAGEIHSVVFTLAPTEPGTRLWVGGEFALAARLSPAGPLEFELEVGAVIPLLRNRFFVVGETQTAFQQPVLMPFTKLSAGVHFL